MKKIFAIVAVSSLAVTAAHAQSSGIPAFSSETEKKAWIEANPEQYRQAVKADNVTFQPAKQAVMPAAEVRTSERPAPANKVAEQAPAIQPKQNVQRIDARNVAAQPAQAAPVRAVDANLESKRLPANYPNTDNRTSKSDQ